MVYLTEVMSDLKIITLPHESLRMASRKVGLIDESILSIIETMQEQTRLWDESREHEVTVALAAVQINELWKIVIIREDFDDKQNHNYVALINPEITKYEGKVDEDFEGCLSVRDFYARVPRYEKIRVKALAIDGKEVKFNAEGFLARVLQHEIDHTKGITIVDRVKDRENGFQIIGTDGKLAPVALKEVQKTGILLDD